MQLATAAAHEIWMTGDNQPFGNGAPASEIGFVFLSLSLPVKLNLNLISNCRLIECDNRPQSATIGDNVNRPINGNSNGRAALTCIWPNQSADRSLSKWPGARARASGMEVAAVRYRY